MVVERLMKNVADANVVLADLVVQNHHFSLLSSNATNNAPHGLFFRVRAVHITIAASAQYRLTKSGLDTCVGAPFVGASHRNSVLCIRLLLVRSNERRRHG